MKKLVSICLWGILGIVAYAQDFSSLKEGFQNPPASSRPQVWWHWMNGNITRDGIRKDIEWMDRAGLAGFHVFDAGLNTQQVVPERLIYMDEGWKDAFRYAIRTGKEHGMEITIASSPGWSATGGPWVEPKDAMKRLTWREMRIRGGELVSVPLPEPYTNTGKFQNVDLGGDAMDALAMSFKNIRYYEDIAVLAVRVAPQDRTLEELGAKISSSGGSFTVEKMTDGDLNKVCRLPADKESGYAWIQYEFPGPQTISALSLMDGRIRGYWSDDPPTWTSVLEKSDDGEHFTEVVKIPSGGTYLQTISFEPVTAKFFRVKVANPLPDMSMAAYGAQPVAPKYSKIAEFRLYPTPRIHHAEEKAGFASPHDLHDYPTVSEGDFPREVIDVTDKVRDGVLTWDAPEGVWKILRFGYALTGKVNHPAPREATGHEVDKLDPVAFERYVRNYLDTYVNALGGSLEGLDYILMDSYEAEFQTWTSAMKEEFRARRGYDLLPWLPVLTGEIIGSARESEQFLSDWRKTIGELIYENYGRMRRIAREYGMKGLYAEAHEGGRVYVVDGMDVKRQADIPMAACWVPTPGTGSPLEMSVMDIRESASVAHLWGKNLVAGESLTTSGMNGKGWSFDPRSLKWVADTELWSGLNRFVIHESAHQPADTLQPGLGLLMFGQWFNRHETWAGEARSWTDYLARSSYLLQQGKAVVDILLYYGEDTSVVAEYGLQMPDFIPAGYNYDFINPTGLMELLSVEKGDLVTPSGMRYKVLCVDADEAWMSPEIRARIAELKRSGALVCTPSELTTVLEKIQPDATMQEDMRFVHRHTDDAEIYWVNKPSADTRTIEVSFRVKGLKPTLWHPETGRMEAVSYYQKAGRTFVSVPMVPDDAVFVVFAGKGKKKETVASPAEKGIQTLKGPWTLSFQKGRGAPEKAEYQKLASWTESKDFGIRHFSGTVAYKTTFPASSAKGRAYLDLGNVKNIAHIYINGKDCGTLWKEPWTVEVTDELREGENELVVEVTNLWPNRIIGDLHPDCPQKVTYTHMQFYTPESPLLESGLLGPVKLTVYE